MTKLEHIIYSCATPWYQTVKQAEHDEQWIALIAARNAGEPGAASALRRFEETD